jgi:hypothetical protein
MQNGIFSQQGMFDHSEEIDQDYSGYLASILDDAIGDIPPSIWVGSPFEPLSKLASRQRGRVGEDLVRLTALNMGLDARKANNDDGDLWINGILVEVKLAMQCHNGGFIINQIRPNQNFNQVVILALRPSFAELYTVPKIFIERLSTGQHGGSTAAETMMYSAESFYRLNLSFSEYRGTGYFKDFFEVK